MRKLRRWAFNALTILSLLLCIATAAVWVRSYRHYSEIHWEVGGVSHHSRPWWQHCRWLGAIRGTLMVQSEYLEVSDIAFHGEFPRTWTASYLERQASYFISCAAMPTEKAISFAGFQIAYPRNSEVVAASKHPPRKVYLVYELILPLWSLTLLFALLPSLSLLRLIRRRRIPPGHCRHCGYNLHANLSGTCPECGRPTAPAEPRRV